MIQLHIRSYHPTLECGFGPYIYSLTPNEQGTLSKFPAFLRFLIQFSDMSPTYPALFQPIQVGAITLAHRVVLAPLTRARADSTHTHGNLAVEYYSQRSRVPGTLLISEGTFISAKESGVAHAPGIYTDGQIAAWKRVSNEIRPRRDIICFMPIASREMKLTRRAFHRSRTPCTQTARTSFSNYGQ